MVCITEGGEPPPTRDVYKMWGSHSPVWKAERQRSSPQNPSITTTQGEGSLLDVRSSAHLNVSHCLQLSVRVSKCQRKPGLERR